jgi:hypothetical protein
MQLSSSRINPRRRAAVNSKLERKLWMYAAAASAAGVGMFTGTPADAEIVVTHINTAISPSVALDLNHDGIVDFNLTKWLANASIQAFSYLLVCHEGYQAASHQCLSSSSQPNDANVVRGTSQGALDLPFGAPIGPGQQFAGKKGRVLMGGRQAVSFSSIHDQTCLGSADAA